jgi:hypothetical protein
MKRTALILAGALLGWLLAPALPSAAPLFQAVLLHVGTGASATALTATDGKLNVNCQ